MLCIDTFCPTAVLHVDTFRFFPPLIVLFNSSVKFRDGNAPMSRVSRNEIHLVSWWFESKRLSVNLDIQHVKLSFAVVYNAKNSLFSAFFPNG